MFLVLVCLALCAHAANADEPLVEELSLGGEVSVGPKTFMQDFGDKHLTDKSAEAMIEDGAGRGRQLEEGFELDIDDTTISSGFMHTCALAKSDAGGEGGEGEIGGTLRCWGDNSKGQTRAPEGSFVQVSSGHFSSCAISADDDTVKCWGYRGMDSVPLDVRRLQFQQISVGGFHVCGLLQDGTIRCWGKNYDGQSKAPEGTFVQVSSGRDHSCAIRTDGSGVCWGSNSHGERDVPRGYQWSQLSASPWHHTCGVTVDEEVFCFGANGFGQSEHGRGTFVQVSAGRKFTCGLRSDAKIACWGQNTQYQICEPPTEDFLLVNAGYQHVCAVRADTMETVCWGNNVLLQTSVPADFEAAI